MAGLFALGIENAVLDKPAGLELLGIECLPTGQVLAIEQLHPAIIFPLFVAVQCQGETDIRQPREDHQGVPSFHESFSEWIGQCCRVRDSYTRWVVEIL